MNEHIDHAAGTTHVAGGTHAPDTEAMRREIAEAQREVLIEALADALTGAPHWRHQAQELLRKLAERPR
jgi:hypothetical protein